MPAGQHDNFVLEVVLLEFLDYLLRKLWQKGHVVFRVDNQGAALPAAAARAAKGISIAEADFATQRDVGRRKRDIRTISLKVKLENPKGAYVPGMTAEVLVSPEQLKGSVEAAGKK